jgi:hypothetical protein
MTLEGLLFLILFIGGCFGFLGLLAWAEIRTRR